MPMLSKVSALLLLIAQMVERILAKVRTEKRQTDREALHDCPADWFGDHFGGLCDDDYANKTTETEPDD